MSFGPIVQELIYKDLNLWVSDKEGGFVVLDPAAYSKRATAALVKIFFPVDDRQTKKAKQVAPRLLDHNNLTSLSTKLRKTKESHLEVFFSAKTDKQDVPFLVIVSERGTWQTHLSSYLANNLSLLQIDGPYRISNSEQLIAYFQANGANVVCSFSIDVDNMYYSIPSWKFSDLSPRHHQCISECSWDKCGGIIRCLFVGNSSTISGSTLVCAKKWSLYRFSGSVEIM